MTNKQNRYADTFGRIDGFGKLYPEDFILRYKSGQLLVVIRTAATELTEHAVKQSSSGASSRAGTETKGDLYEDLYEDLVEINRAAKAMIPDHPGITEKFRMPRTPSYANLLISARAFLKDATPLEAQFLEYELEEGFLAELEADIAAFDKAEDDQGDGLTERVGATQGIAEAIRTGVAAVRRLDPLMRNKYRRDTVKLAAWITASHTEREPKRAKAAAVQA